MATIQIRGVQIQDESIEAAKINLSGSFDFRAASSFIAATPSADADVATKGYVDSQIADGIQGGNGIDIDTSEFDGYGHSCAEHKYHADNHYLSAIYKIMFSKIENFPFKKVVIISHNVDRLPLTSINDIREYLTDTGYENTDTLTIVQKSYQDTYNITSSHPSLNDYCYMWMNTDSPIIQFTSEHGNHGKDY